MRVLDLFCGAGGLSYGFELTGAFSVVGGVDSFDRAMETFAANHVHASKKLAGALDITTLDPKDVKAAVGGRVDLIIGGPPCQGFSNAGRRLNDDPRNQMIIEYQRFVREIRPMAFVMENVSGLLTTAQSRKGQIMEQLQEEYWELGYATAWKILNSADYRVPQRRKRLILVGTASKDRVFEFPEAPCGEEPKMFRFPEAFQTVSNALDDLPSPTAADPQAYDAAPTTWLQRYLRKGSDTLHNHLQTKHSPDVLSRIEQQPQGTRLYPTWNHSWYRLDPTKPSPAVKENHRAPFVHHRENRATSPRECARLQTFPDKFILSGTKTHQLIQVGNAVPCLMAAHIATALASHLGLRVPIPWDASKHPWM